MPLSRSDVRSHLRDLLEGARGVAPHLRVALVFGDPSDFPNERDFAMCGLVRKNHARVIVAPKIVDEPLAVVSALLRHEIAHAVLLNLGADDHAERDADSMAEAIWKAPIYYDERDVETLEPGTRPRPGRLPR